jgi:hypothetical protein
MWLLLTVSLGRDSSGSVCLLAAAVKCEVGQKIKYTQRQPEHSSRCDSVVRPLLSCPNRSPSDAPMTPKHWEMQGPVTSRQKLLRGRRCKCLDGYLVGASERSNPRIHIPSIFQDTESWPETVKQCGGPLDPVMQKRLVMA